MSVNTVNISFNKEMLNKIDKIAKEEDRTRSDLLREAARMYIERKKRWEQIFSYGDNQKKTVNIPEPELQNEIHQYRNQKRTEN